MNKKIVLVLTISIIASSFMFQSNMQAEVKTNNSGIYFVTGFGIKILGTYGKVKEKLTKKSNIGNMPHIRKKAEKDLKQLETLHKEYLKNTRDQLSSKKQELINVTAELDNKIGARDSSTSYISGLKNQVKQTESKLMKLKNELVLAESGSGALQGEIEKLVKKKAVLAKEINEIEEKIK